MFFVLQSKKRSRVARKSADTSVLSLSGDDFIFSQNTIVASVALERNTHLIHPETIQFVNNNGDTWSNPAMKANYKSFIGAYNYVNHVQEPEKSVGFVADCALRRIPINKDSGLHVYYVDILTATHRDFSDLCDGITSGDIEYLSMGCDAYKSQCSKCGEVFEDEDSMCDCLYQSKGKVYVDSKGKRRVIAELLGDHKPGSVVFMEASWLTEVPAFEGASKRSLLKIPRGSTVEIKVPADSAKKDSIKRFVDQ